MNRACVNRAGVTRAGALLAGLMVLTSAGFLGGFNAAAQTDSGVRIELTEMTPRLVTADGPTVLTVTGHVLNNGDRPVLEPAIRVQRGDPIGTDGDLQAALSGDLAVETVRPRFTSLPDALHPGASLPFRVEIPLRGASPDSLQITEPGLHPLLVHLNGHP